MEKSPRGQPLGLSKPERSSAASPKNLVIRFYFLGTLKCGSNSAAR